MKLIFLGAPGAGKGTQAEVISEKYGIPMISTGVALREAVKNGTERGIAAKSYMDEGKLVPDGIIIGILKDRLADDDCKSGFILDGVPRTIAQADAINEMGIEIDGVINIHVTDEMIIERMSGRRSCESCGATYHTVYNPSANGENCGKCGKALSIRKDDLPETVIERLKTYHEQTEPLIEYYNKKNLLKTVIGQIELKDTTRLTLETIESI